MRRRGKVRASWDTLRFTPGIKAGYKSEPVVATSSLTSLEVTDLLPPRSTARDDAPPFQLSSLAYPPPTSIVLGIPHHSLLSYLLGDPVLTLLSLPSLLPLVLRPSFLHDLFSLA